MERRKLPAHERHSRIGLQSLTVKSGLERPASSRMRVQMSTRHIYRFRFAFSSSVYFRQFLREIEVGGSSASD
jgi:hypothetical protein